MNKYFLPVAASAVAGVVLLGACGGDDSKPEPQVKGTVSGKHTETCDLDLMAAAKPGPGGSRSNPKTSVSKAPAVDTSKPTKAPATPTLVPPTSYPPKNGGSTGGGKKKGCKTEYELEVQTNEGIFEEDVTSEVYGICDKGEKYPACREGK